MVCVLWKVEIRIRPVRNEKMTMIIMTHVVEIASVVVEAEAEVTTVTMKGTEVEETTLVVAVVASLLDEEVAAVAAVVDAEVARVIELTTTLLALFMVDISGAIVFLILMEMITGRGQAIMEIKIPRVEEMARGAATLIIQITMVGTITTVKEMATTITMKQLPAENVVKKEITTVEQTMNTISPKSVPPDGIDN